MAKAKAESKLNKPQEGMRNLTEAEIAEMQGDDTPPEGYSNTTLLDTPAPAIETPEAKAAPETTEETPEAVTENKESTPEAKPKTITSVVPASSEDTFIKLETELAKPEGKEDLTKFTPREKAYFHQMRRDRKARQKAEEERDGALFTITKLKNPPPPPPDPLAGLADDDVLSVAEVREKLAKNPPPAAPPSNIPAGPSAQAVHYLSMCEKEARAAHPSDFDAVMELSDELISNDPIALKEISEATARGENPAEKMYQVVKRHKDFNDLLPAAEIRAKARLKAPAAPPASPSTPAAPATPEDKAKTQKATDAERALENNANRPKTTAHVSSREGKPVEDLTLEDITQMSDMEFAKLPRHVRNKYLKQYGA